MDEFEIVCAVDGPVSSNTYPNLPGGGIFGYTCTDICPLGSTHSVIGHRVIKHFSENETKIKEEDIPTQGFMEVIGYTYIIPSGNTGDISYHSTIIEENINVYEVNLLSTSCNDGDEFSMYSGPATPVGVLTQALGLSGEYVFISEPGLLYFKKGFTVGIKSGTDPVVPVGRISDLDFANGKVKLRFPSEYSFDQGCYVYLWVTRGSNIPLVNHIQTLGNGKIGGSYAEKGMQVVILYKNNTGLAKKFRLSMENTY